jgi:predicted DsbA family dithiol-disulfide isomerase
VNDDNAGNAQGPVTIDIVSDAVCPWCFVGQRNLEAALGMIGDAKVEVRWRPYQLDATIPQGGMSRKDYLTRKFGPDGYGKMNQRLIDLGKERGIAFAFDRIERSPNTLDAHRVIRWAQATGHQHALVEALFKLYFEEGRDIGDRDLLADVAAAHGLDRAQVRARLDTETDKDAVREEIASAQRLGVNGVPFFIFGGKYALSGAQPPQTIAQVIEKTKAEAAPE